LIPASSIKGVLRDGQDGLEEYGFVNKEIEVGGKKQKISQAGDLSFTDARILCLPVRSYKGTFALLTCPLVLQRLTRDKAAFGLTSDISNIPEPQETEALVTSETLVMNAQVILEDIDLTATQSDPAKQIGSSIAQQLFTEETEHELFLQRFAIVHNDVFAFFSETAMEVNARIALEHQSKTVKDGQLWYEEAIPAETIFSSFVTSRKGSFSAIENRSPIQIGGKASIGRGLLRMVVR
jgi:CRISPR-associated protein Cmr4